ncbi:pyridine nucleotide-disulfide oxidoreductase-domain-containing protein [Pelagophyceae sp. CCMP2097]|nr:pyridine nucleotide-disulfide oxidoreductase-domain-containing protein [Pelagophyceae sp. CCMP2097]
MVRWVLALGWGALAAGLHAPPRHAAGRNVGLRAGNEEDVRAELGRRTSEDVAITEVAIAVAPAIAAPAAAPVDDHKDLDVLALVGEKLLIAAESDAGVQPLRERIVVLGSGWGAASLVSTLGENAAVTVISPRNYFLFTPMLAGAAVGTVEFRSITQPLRSLSPTLDYLEAAATKIDVANKRVTCEAVVCEGSQCDIEAFDVDYDRLIVAVGATTNTFGVPGVREHCRFLKEIGDAEGLRQALGNCFERANLPSLSDAERRRALSFVVVGAGPTGVEFCAELRDFLGSEATKYYPDLLQLAKVTLLEATTTILGPFDASLREVALEKLRASVATNNAVEISPVDVRLGAAVSEVNQTHVMVGKGDDMKTIPYGICVWATGNGACRVVSDVIPTLGEEQTAAQPKARGRVAVDRWLRVVGAPAGEVFSLGDCAADASRPLPATAQVASQQGEFLARLLLRYDVAAASPARPADAAVEASWAESAYCKKENGAVVARPFQFLNLGILAYVGQSEALAQIGDSGISVTGRAAFALWRSVYLAKQLSLRNRLLVVGDWTRAVLFGRDITRF